MSLLWKEIFCLNYFIHLLTDLSIPVGLVLSHYHLSSVISIIHCHKLSFPCIQSFLFLFAHNLPSLAHSLFVFNLLMLTLCLYSAFSHYLCLFSHSVRIQGFLTLSISKALLHSLSLYPCIFPLHFSLSPI